MTRVSWDDLEWDDCLVAHEGLLFTGDAFELYPSGGLWSEESYLDGRLEGVCRSTTRREN
jgi:hypothetical protein